jgi:hypothetical protein
MTQRPDHLPGQSAPASAIYEQMNIFNSPTGVRVKVVRGEPLPSAPMGHSWAVVKGDAGSADAMMARSATEAAS